MDVLLRFYCTPIERAEHNTRSGQTVLFDINGKECLLCSILLVTQKNVKYSNFVDYELEFDVLQFCKLRMRV